MSNLEKSAVELHEQVPPNWYFQSLRADGMLRVIKVRKI
jgi:hypothetical protein